MLPTSKLSMQVPLPTSHSFSWLSYDAVTSMLELCGANLASKMVSVWPASVRHANMERTRSNKPTWETAIKARA